MKMLDWIRKQLDYRAKYLAAVEASREASANALAVMGQYDYLCANLPYEHDHGYADDAFTHWMPLPEPPK
jgi:Protein of unknown function (DUF551)